MVPFQGDIRYFSGEYQSMDPGGSLFRCTRAYAEGDFVVVVEGLFLICFVADLFKEI